MTYTLSDPRLFTNDANLIRHVRDLLLDGNSIAPIDNGVAEIVRLFNEKGCITEFSCSGLLRDHWAYDDVVDDEYVEYLIKNTDMTRDKAVQVMLEMVFNHNGYIAFKAVPAFDLPDGFHYTKSYDKAIYLNRMPERQKLEAWDRLMTVARSLPTLTT